MQEIHWLCSFLHRHWKWQHPSLTYIQNNRILNSTWLSCRPGRAQNTASCQLECLTSSRPNGLNKLDKKVACQVRAEIHILWISLKIICFTFYWQAAVDAKTVMFHWLSTMKINISVLSDSDLYLQNMFHTPSMYQRAIILMNKYLLSTTLTILLRNKHLKV